MHIAGNDLRVGNLLRQRCAWCGAVLVDYDLERIAVPDGQDPTPATWPIGGLVLVDGNMTTVVAVAEHMDGTQLPSNACGVLDPAVTA